jgi:hypothetical protein
MIKEISKQRFDALTFAVLPTAHIILEEIAWFADDEENFLAAIVYDRIDNDCGFVILARNEKNIFNCIDANHSFKQTKEVKEALLKKIREYIAGGKHIHVQASVARIKCLSFDPGSPSPQKPRMKQKALHHGLQKEERRRKSGHLTYLNPF